MKWVMVKQLPGDPPLRFADGSDFEYRIAHTGDGYGYGYGVWMRPLRGWADPLTPPGWELLLPPSRNLAAAREAAERHNLKQTGPTAAPIQEPELQPLSILITQAIAEPASVIERQKIRAGGHEPMTSWQTRAVCQVLTDHGIDPHLLATRPNAIEHVTEITDAEDPGSIGLATAEWRCTCGAGSPHPIAPFTAERRVREHLADVTCTSNASEDTPAVGRD